MSVYRKAPHARSKVSPPRELVFEAVDRASTSSSAVVLFKIVTLPALVALGLSVVVNGTVGGVGLLVTLAYSIWSARRRREGALLTIDDGKLTVVPRGTRARTDSMKLSQLDGVELDIKKIQRVQEGGSAIPAVRFIDSTVGPEVDTARIVIVGAERRILLSDAYLAHVDAVEWLGKIRVFLRKNGWVPPDEQPETDDTPESAP